MKSEIKVHSDIADLTKAMGLTPQSLYAAFGSKAQLYREALEWYQLEIGRQTVRDLESGSDVATALANVLRSAARDFARADTPRGCMISTALLNCATEHEPVAAWVAEYRTATLGRVRERVRDAMAQGQVRPEADAEGIARFVGAIIQGLSVQAIDGATEQELNALVDVAVPALQRILSLRPD